MIGFAGSSYFLPLAGSSICNAKLCDGGGGYREEFDGTTTPKPDSTSGGKKGKKKRRRKKKRKLEIAVLCRTEFEFVEIVNRATILVSV